MLHVTNGASAAARIRAAGHRGDMLTWDDALHEGPLATGPGSRALRARFLAEHGWGDATALEGDLERRDARLARAVAEAEPIVLWFEHDLYDQLQLLQVLTALDGAPAELIQATVFLGASATDLAPLWAARARVTAAQTALARATRPRCSPPTRRPRRRRSWATRGASPGSMRSRSKDWSRRSTASCRSRRRAATTGASLRYGSR